MMCRNCDRQISSQNHNCPHCGATRSRAAAAPQVAGNALKIGAMALGAIATIAAVASITAPRPSVRVAIVAPAMTPAMAAALTQERYDDGRYGALGPAVSGLIWKYVISAANIRNYPTAQGSQIVGRLLPGQRVRGVMYRGMVDGNTFWFKLADGRGWVSAVNLGDYYSGNGGGYVPPPQPRPQPQPQGYCYISTTSGNLRIRATPSGAIVGALPNGTRVRIFGESSDNYGVWVRIGRVNGYALGWVSRDYVIC